MSYHGHDDSCPAPGYKCTCTPKPTLDERRDELAESFEWKHIDDELFNGVADAESFRAGWDAAKIVFTKLNPEPSKAIAEMQAEIEQLKSEVDIQDCIINNRDSDILNYQEENQKLREALEEIKDSSCEAFQHSDIARKALEG